MNSLMNKPAENAVANQRLKKRTKVSQWYFNPLLLALYDLIVYRFVSKYIWGCPNQVLITRYKKYIGEYHLEVGVGTGYLIEKSKPNDINLDLMDLSLACLQRSRKRLSKYSPKIIRHNILETPLEDDKHYDSIGINYVMHCVAGDYKVKGIAFTNLKKLLKNNGVLFGACVLPTEKSSHLAKLFMAVLDKLGIFNTSGDKVEDLVLALEKNFDNVTVEIKSSVVLFVASDNKEGY